jgi:L-seryl-tRNA(Ser) seleniumtransferase
MSGFTERPALDDLVSLARRFDLPLIEDLGSGWLGFAAGDALALEPSVPASLRAGVDLVAFSGDKLLGGPQAGILAGRRSLVERIGRHPLMRAVRADKLTYAVLETTLALWMSETTRAHVPVYAMIAMPASGVGARAARLVERLAHVPRLTLQMMDGVSTVGGGSSPGSALPTTLVAASVDGLSASALEAALRASDPPVIARITDDRVLLDLRTVLEEDDDAVASALQAVAQGDAADTG